MSSHISNERPAFDKVLTDIADYALGYEIKSDLAYETARYCLIDTLGCGLEALEYPACTKLLGPIVPGTVVPHGARVPGTSYQLDPVQAAFNIGAMIRWLDFNDTWLAAEWGHPSDNLGGILAVADWLSRTGSGGGQTAADDAQVLTAMIKAHEIQGCIALENSFNKVGLDHVVLVKVASTAVVCELLGLTREQTMNALSLAWVDGQSLRTYRHAPNTGSRKSWAAGDATSRAVRLALMARAGEMGYPSALTAKTWGFYDVSFRGQEFKFQRPYGSYVMENVLFKISFPAEFHAQTAVEAAMTLRGEARCDGQDGRRYPEDHDSHARGLSAHHRQERAAVESGGSRSLRAVHDCDSADLRTADGGGLRGSSCGRSAHRCVAGEGGVRRRAAVYEGLSRSGEAFDCECAARGAERRDSARRDGRVSDRASSGGARKGCRCWWRSSNATWRGDLARSSSSGFWMLRSIASGWSECR